MNYTDVGIEVSHCAHANIPKLGKEDYNFNSQKDVFVGSEGYLFRFFRLQVASIRFALAQFLLFNNLPHRITVSEFYQQSKYIRESILISIMIFIV